MPERLSSCKALQSTRTRAARTTPSPRYTFSASFLSWPSRLGRCWCWLTPAASRGELAAFKSIFMLFRCRKARSLSRSSLARIASRLSRAAAAAASLPLVVPALPPDTDAPFAREVPAEATKELSWLDDGCCRCCCCCCCGKGVFVVAPLPPPQAESPFGDADTAVAAKVGDGGDASA